MPFPARVSCWPSRGRLHGADMIVLAPGLAGTDAPWSAVPVSGAGRTACLRRGQAGLPWSTAHAKCCWPCPCSQARESPYGRCRRKAEFRPRIEASPVHARRCPAAQVAFVHWQPGLPTLEAGNDEEPSACCRGHAPQAQADMQGFESFLSGKDGRLAEMRSARCTSSCARRSGIRRREGPAKSALPG